MVGVAWLSACFVATQTERVRGSARLPACPFLPRVKPVVCPTFMHGNQKRGAATRLIPFILAFLASAVHAADWPMYRADAGRGNYTSEALPADLSLRWVYKPAHPPRPAWPRESVMTFDRAYHAVADAERVYFGSSADGKVYALDAATGEERWTVFTNAPVRFAPALWKDRLFAVSDDGLLYCLSKETGRLLWKKRPSPSGRMVLGNGRMICKWPARGGPAIVEDTVYFAAGIWPNDGVYICAVDAATGKTVWVNDTSGTESLHQPHAPKPIKSGVSAQGYLCAAGNRLFVPTGRSVPAAFDRSTGKFLYHHLGPDAFRTSGGTEIAAVDDLLFNAGMLLNAADGQRLKVYYRKGRYFRLSGASTFLLAAAPKHIYTGAVSRFDRANPIVDREYEIKKNGGASTTKKLPGLNGDWGHRIPLKGAKNTLAVAGETAIVGGQGFVAAVVGGEKKVLWNHKIGASALSLAVAAGRLFVSTDRGWIYCFARGEGPARSISKKWVESPYGEETAHARAAEEIVRASGVTEGYCLDLGCGDGRLAYELARRTKLNIYGIEKDPAKAALARERLDAAGLYGVRVTIHQGDPARSHFPNHFANLVVSGRSVTGYEAPAEEMMRCARPYGGIVCVGAPGSIKNTVRGPLKGAGAWTHQYADAANTICSGDARVRPSLTMLWFGSLPLGVPNRHGRPPAPLFADGRLYVQGHSAIRAIDAYNGRLLWHFPIKGIGRHFHASGKLGVLPSGGNMCTDGKTIFVRQGPRCLRIDGATGKGTGELRLPGEGEASSGTWGYIAWDRDILFGSVSDEKSLVAGGFRKEGVKLYSESRSVFALDPTSGKPKWQHKAKDSIRTNAIAIGAGCLYLIDRPAAKWGRKSPHLPGVLLALDAATGREKWRAEKVYGTVLSLSTRHDVLIMNYIKKMNTSRRGLPDKANMAAFRASDGTRLWDVTAWNADTKYGKRPVLVDRTIFTGLSAYDLLTGKQRPDFGFHRTYGCGNLAAGRKILTFRSSAIGYRGVTDAAETRHFGGVKPGCWINAIPAGGLVMVPDYTTSCECRYQMRCSLALEPRE